MGGVPNTSKGCNTCRARKIRCDEGKPACDRCTRTGRECGGYERQPRLNGRAGAARAKQHTTKPSVSTSQLQVPVQPIADFHINDPFEPLSPPSTFNSNSPISQYDVSLIPLAAFDPITPPAEVSMLDLTGDHLINSFLDMYYPSDDSYVRSDINHSWVQTAALIPNKGKALPLALHALALSRLGWSRKDEDFSQQGRTAYVGALSEFQKALWDERERRTDRTLAAARALTTYELYEATSFKGWNEHQMGFAGLLKMRGPKAFEDPFPRSLLESFRTTMMYQSVGRREDTFLTTPAWRVPLTAAPIQLINDCGLRIAALLGDIDKANASPTPQLLQVQTTVLARLVDFDLELDSIYARQLTTASPLPLYWDSPAGAGYLAPGGGPGSGATALADPHTPLDFRDLNTAQALINNWALKCLILMNVGFLCNQMSYVDGSVLPWTSDSASSFSSEIIALHQPGSTLGNAQCKNRSDQICRRLAILLARSAHYCTRDEKGLMGPAKCLFGVRISLLMLRLQGAPETSWAEGLYETLGKEKGVGFASRLNEHDNDYKPVRPAGLRDELGSGADVYPEAEMKEEWIYPGTRAQEVAWVAPERVS